MNNWFKRILERHPEGGDPARPVKLNLEFPMTIMVDALLEYYRHPSNKRYVNEPTFMYYEIDPLELEYVANAIDLILVHD